MSLDPTKGHWPCQCYKAINTRSMDRCPGCGDTQIDFFRDALAEVTAQLPVGMEHCTIRFLECAKGHGWLTVTNWVQHECPTCERDALRTQLDAVTKERDEWKESRDHAWSVIMQVQRERNHVLGIAERLTRRARAWKACARKWRDESKWAWRDSERCREEEPALGIIFGTVRAVLQGVASIEDVRPYIEALEMMRAARSGK